MDENTTPIQGKTRLCNLPQQDLVDFFSRAENLDRVISPQQYYDAAKKSRQWFSKCVGRMFFAQCALEANQKSRLEVKVYYEDMLARCMSRFNSETVLEITAALTDEKRNNRYLVSRQTMIDSLSKIASDDTGDVIATLASKAPMRKIDYVGESEARFKRVHDEYVMAPLGETPNIGDIVNKVGEGKLHVDDVRKTAVDENWRAERANYLYQSLDLVPEEVKLVTMLRTVEVHKLLYTHIKILHKMHMDYYKSGRVRSLDGTSDLKFSPDPGSISGLAETMRRLVDGSSSVNIMINNQGKAQGAAGALDEHGMQIAGSNDGRASLMTKKYLTQLNKMSAEEIEAEIDNLTKLRRLVDEKDPDIIDASFETPPEPT